MSDIVKTSEEFAKKEYAKHEINHQWEHIEGVMNIALKLAAFYSKVDLEILKLAVIFHDINYQSHKTHVDESIKMMERFLEKYNYPENKIQKIKEIILAHSSLCRRKLGDTNLIEGKILYDADKFRLAQTPEGHKKYYSQFYLDETRELLDKVITTD